MEMLYQIISHWLCLRFVKERILGPIVLQRVLDLDTVSRAYYNLLSEDKKVLIPYAKIASTGMLNTIENGIPDSVHKTLAGVQEGVYIPSACLCFILLCYSFIHFISYRNGCCGLFLIFTLASIAFIFSIATFVVQIVAYNMIKDEINKAKSTVFGGLFSSIVDIETHIGASVWMSLVSFILLFFVCVFLILTVCCLGERRGDKPRTRRGFFGRRRNRDENYEMGRVF
jgi:hypothetical protein